MAEAAILKNSKIAISRQWFDGSAQHLAWWRLLALRTGPAVVISNFKKSKMADDRHLKKSKNLILINIINSLLKTGHKTANINVKNCSLYGIPFIHTVNGDGSKKGSVNHTNIDIQAMLVWLTLPFYDFLRFSIRRRQQCV